MSRPRRLLPLSALAMPALIAVAPMAEAEEVRNVALVHGAWADGSGWRPIYDILTAEGYTVRMVQNPLTSLADDVAATDRVLDRMDGPTVLVGHSYGGAVITEAGEHPNVAALVYLAAFAPDAGESVFGLIPQDPEHPPPFDVSADGFVFFSEDIYAAGFADALPEAEAIFLRDSQVPISLERSGLAPLTVAAWTDVPSWYQIADADHVIPPAAQEQMAARAGATVETVSGGHLAFIAHADATAAMIMEAAEAVAAAN